MTEAISLVQLHSDYPVFGREIGCVGDQVAQRDVDGGGVGGYIKWLLADIEYQF